MASKYNINFDNCQVTTSVVGDQNVVVNNSSPTDAAVVEVISEIEECLLLFEKITDAHTVEVAELQAELKTLQTSLASPASTGDNLRGVCSSLLANAMFKAMTSS